jgi:hypothetical protein
LFLRSLLAAPLTSSRLSSLCSLPGQKHVSYYRVPIADRDGHALVTCARRGWHRDPSAGQHVATLCANICTHIIPDPQPFPPVSNQLVYRFAFAFVLLHRIGNVVLSPIYHPPRTVLTCEVSLFLYQHILHLMLVDPGIVHGSHCILDRINSIYLSVFLFGCDEPPIAEMLKSLSVAMVVRFRTTW